jgi:hypothetical protein
MFGRFMLPDMSEHPCQVVQLSPEGAVFLTDQVPLGGVPIIAYVDDIGRVEAISADAVPGGFRVLFSLSGSRRERFLSRLEWHKSKAASPGIESRRHVRFEPKDTKSHLTLPDGRSYSCEVIDISLSGAAVKVEVMPSLGTHVMLGKMRGRVVRYHESGVAIEFVKPLNPSQLSEQVG